MIGASFPNYRQLDKMDCGPSCLKIISAFYGGHHDLDTLRMLSGVGKDGVSVGGLLEACKHIQMDSMAISVSFAELAKEVPLPCIVHWSSNHFMVVYKISKGKVYVSDPAIGLMTYKEEAFISGWTDNKNLNNGTAVILRPRSDFVTGTENETERNTFTILFDYFKPYKKYLLQVVVGILIGTLIQVSLPFLTQSIVDYGINYDNPSFILIILVAQLVLYLTQSGIEFIRGWILLHITTRVNIQIISDFILILMGMPIAYFDSKNTGDFIQRIVDHDRINTFLSGNSLVAIMGILNIIIFSLVLMYFNLNIFLIFLFGTIIYVVWNLVFLKRRAVLDHLKFEQDSRNQSQIMQLIQGIEEIKFNASQNRRRAEWYHTQINLFKISVQALRLNQIQIKGGSIVNEIKNIIIIFVAANGVVNGNITLGAMLAISYIIGSLNVPLRDIIKFLLNYQDAKLSLRRLVEIHNSKPESIEAGLESIPKSKEILFNNVSFRYPSAGPKPILRELNCSFPIGKITAIVGSSGSGKTTLLKLLLMVYKPLEGKITLDGKNLHSINKEQWRKACGVVLQKGYIFDDTLKNNITESGSLLPFDRDKYDTALDVANLGELLETLPHGSETKLIGGGNNLSGGERQRILIARAVYKNPDFLFFDEATSSLDSKNELEIMNKLEKFYQNKTVVVIAHRLSTVKNADKIIVLEKGEIVESGNHEELLQMKGAYYQLVTNQL